MRLIFEGVLFPPDDEGVSGCALLGIPVHGIGDTPNAALRSAAAVLKEALADMVTADETNPEPTFPLEDELSRGRHIAIVVSLTEAAV